MTRDERLLRLEDRMDTVRDHILAVKEQVEELNFRCRFLMESGHIRKPRTELVLDPNEPTFREITLYEEYVLEGGRARIVAKIEADLAQYQAFLAEQEQAHADAEAARQLEAGDAGETASSPQADGDSRDLDGNGHVIPFTPHSATKH